MSLSVSGLSNWGPHTPPPLSRPLSAALARHVTVLLGLTVLLNYFKTLGAFVVGWDGDHDRNIPVNSCRDDGLAIKTYPNGIIEHGVFCDTTLTYGFRNYSQVSFDFGHFTDGKLHGRGFRQYNRDSFCSGHFADGQVHGDALCMEFEPTGVHRAQGHYVSDSMSSGMVNILRRDGLEIQTISDFRPINHTKSRNLGTQFNSTLTNAADEQRSIVSDFPPFFDPYNIPPIVRDSHLEALPTRTMTDGHGDRFTGYVFNDHMVFGTRTNRERGVYTGWFDADGKASGCGRTVFPDSTTESGLYLADRFIGGEVNHSDGIRLIGRQVNFSLHGDNCLVIGSNWFRHGSFRHNRLNGNGSFVSTKLIEMGVLRDGELVSGELWLRQSGVIRVGDFDANGLVNGYEINHDDRGFVRTTVDGNQRVSDSPTEFPYLFNPYAIPPIDIDSRLRHLPVRTVVDGDGTSYDGHFVGASIVFGTKRSPDGIEYRGYFDSYQRMHGLGSRRLDGTFEERGYFHQNEFIGGTVVTPHYSDIGARKEGALHGNNATRVDMDGYRVMRGQFSHDELSGSGSLQYLKYPKYNASGLFNQNRLVDGRMTLFSETNHRIVSYKIPLNTKFNLSIDPDGLARYRINGHLVHSGRPPSDPRCVEIFRAENTPILSNPDNDAVILALLPKLPEWVASLWTGYRRHIQERAESGRHVAEDMVGSASSPITARTIRNQWERVIIEFPNQSPNRQDDFLAFLAEVVIGESDDSHLLHYLKNQVSQVLTEDWQVLSGRRPIARADHHISILNFFDIPILTSFVGYANQHRHPALAHVSLIPSLTMDSNGYYHSILIRNDDLYRKFVTAFFPNSTINSDEIAKSHLITDHSELTECHGLTYLLPRTAITHFWGDGNMTYFADNAFYRVKSTTPQSALDQLDQWLRCARPAMEPPSQPPIWKRLIGYFLG